MIGGLQSVWILSPVELPSFGNSGMNVRIAAGSVAHVSESPLTLVSIVTASSTGATTCLRSVEQVMIASFFGAGALTTGNDACSLNQNVLSGLDQVFESRLESGDRRPVPTQCVAFGVWQKGR